MQTGASSVSVAPAASEGPGGELGVSVEAAQAAADLSAVEQQQIFRLMMFGFSRKKIVEALREQAAGREMADEDEALGLLLRRILLRRRGAAAAAAEEERQARLAAMAEGDELAEMWEEEQEALAGIFDADFAKVGRARCEITLRCALGDGAAGHAAEQGRQLVDGEAEHEIRMVVVVPEASRYPAEPPLVAFLCAALLPKTCLEVRAINAHLRARHRLTPSDRLIVAGLQVTKRLLKEAARLVSTNLTEFEAPAPVLWELSSWLEEELPKILQLVMPGRGLFGDDVELQLEPEPEPQLKAIHKTKYDRSREREAKKQAAQKKEKRLQMERKTHDPIDAQPPR